MNVEIRPFEPRDRAAVIALWNEVFADDPPRNEPSGMIDRKLYRALGYQVEERVSLGKLLR